MSGIWGTARRSRRDAVPAPRRRIGLLAAGADIPPGERAHRWLVGDRASVAAWLAETAPRNLGVLPGHSRLRGPFTASGTLVRSLAPDLVANSPELTRSYSAPMLAVAPDLEWLLGPATPARPGHDHAHVVGDALAALTIAYTQARGRRQGLAVLDVDALDPTDAAWLSVLLTNADPAYLEIVLAGASPVVASPLAAALARHAVRIDLAPLLVGAPDATAQTPGRLARAYVASECLSDDPAQRAAYDALHPADRAALHDTRAARLEVLGEPSLRLGAIPFHRERGSAPGAGVAALTYAVSQCFRSGWYDAAVEFGNRLRAMLGPEGGSFPLLAGA
jgi:hypothetical protein